MTTKETGENNKNINKKVIDITNRMPKKEVITNSDDEYSEEAEDALELGLETFEEGLTNAKGFLTITFDEEGQPSVIHAGELDLIRTLGTLDYVKNELLNNDFRLENFDKELFDDVDPTTFE